MKYHLLEGTYRTYILLQFRDRFTMSLNNHTLNYILKSHLHNKAIFPGLFAFPAKKTKFLVNPALITSPLLFLTTTPHPLLSSPSFVMLALFFCVLWWQSTFCPPFLHWEVKQLLCLLEFLVHGN